MNEHFARSSADTVVATHCWWHLALFHLSRGRSKDALALYDRRVRAARSSEIADLIDAASLLWRIALHGGDAGTRWAELAAAWAAHIDDGFCSFNDLHAMLAFVGARDWQRASASSGRCSEAGRCRRATARPRVSSACPPAGR